MGYELCGYGGGEKEGYKQSLRSEDQKDMEILRY